MRKGDKPLRTGSKIDLSAVLTAAFAVLEEGGYDGLTIRAVADRLKVQPPALYWHVRNRAELVTRMAATYMDVAAQREIQAEGWPAMLEEFARGLREVMLRHRDSARLCLSAQPKGKPSESMKSRLAPLLADGLKEKDALLYQASIMAFTVGWVGYEQSPAMHEYLAKIIDFNASFEGGLQALIRGLVDQKTGRIESPKRQLRDSKRLAIGRGS
jgi:TetR/AcrR family tetracycline transcriptional repressor